MTIVEAPLPAKAFPAADVEVALRNELLAALNIEASLRGISLPTDPTAASAIPLEIDSLVVVSLLCGLEPLMGFQIPEGIVQAGGYQSVNDTVTHLMPKLGHEWLKRRSK